MYSDRHASELLETTSRRQASVRLARIPESTDIQLAWALKDQAYAAWTTEPAKVRRSADVLKMVAKRTRSDEIDAIECWISGIADVTRGRLPEAVDKLSEASRKFLAIHREEDAAQPKVAELMVLARLGRNDEAMTVGREAMRIFLKHGDDLAAGKIEMNLANLFSRLGRHKESAKYYRSAIHKFRKLKEGRWLAMALNDLAIAYTELGDLKKADDFFDEALTAAKSEEMLLTQAEIYASRSNLALFRGDYAEAMRQMETAREIYSELAMPHETAVSGMEIADLYGQVGLRDEAEALYVDIIRTLSRLRMRREEARARRSLARIYAFRGDHRKADNQLERARSLFRKQDDRVAEAGISLELAELAIRSRNFDEAIARLDEAVPHLDRKEHARSLMTERLIRLEANIGRGADREAAGKLKSLIREARRREYKQLVISAQTLYGRLLLASGDVVASRRQLNGAAKMIEAARGQFSADEFRRSFMGSQLEPFELLSKIALRHGRPRDVLCAVERQRAQALLSSMGLESVTGNETALIRRARELRTELNWLYERYSPDDKVRIAKTESELKDLDRRIGALSVTGNAPGRADFDPKSLMAALGRSRAMIEYFVIDGQFSALVITDKAIRLEKGLVSAPAAADAVEALRFQLRGLRYGGSLSELMRARIDAKINERLRSLYDLLIRPFEKELSDRELIVSPSGVLDQIPFSALFDGENYLVEGRRVSSVPSSSIWLKLSSVKTARGRGDLLMGYADESIPLVEDEVREIGRIFPNAKSLIGDQATFSGYFENSRTARLIHLACHASFRTDDALFSSLHLADGWLTVSDISSHPIKADLVTLSACETGVNEVREADELLGLVRGFLTAGARSLLVSLWRVDDAISRELMVSFYESLQRGRPVSASLRDAQMALIRRSVSPFYWSPFVLVGADR